MRNSRGIHCSAFSSGAALFFFLFAGSTGLEATNATGFIQSNGWLALGPFSDPFGCSGRKDDLLTPHIAPSKLEDQAPNAGDEIDYDINLASTTSYNGPASPLGKPMWRVLDEGDTPADDLDLDSDALKVGSPSDDVCTFLATYFRYSGAAPVDVVLCTNSDDGIQVWMDKRLALNNNACRGRSIPPLCQDNTRVTILPGLHRIILGVWDHTGGFGGSLGLKKDGVFITDADLDWEFAGTDSQGFVFPAPKVTMSQTSGVEPLAIDFDASGSTSPGGSIKAFSWDFGDGQTGSGAKVSHTYSAGIYTALLTVTNEKGVSVSVDTLITSNFASQSVTPWQSVDVGSPVMSGGARPQVNCLVVFAGGLDISKSADQFHYVYQERSGNISLTVQVKEALWQSGGRLGPMFRESLDAGSAFAFVDLQYLNSKIRPIYISRGRQGGSASKNVSTEASTLNLAPPNAYLRLEKNGSDFTGSASADGQTWVEVWTETVTGGPDNLLAGLAVTAGDSETRRQAAQISFCQIDLRGGAPPAGPSFHRGDADDNGALQLTDAVRILNFLFLGTGRIDCMDAADADNNGTVQLTDAVRILNVLFLGTGTIPDPGPPGESFGNKPCGIDPDDNHVGCEVYDMCV